MAGSPFSFNVTEILPEAGIGAGNEWLLFVFAALVFGIVIGGTMRGLAKLVLGFVLFSGFGLLLLVFLQKDDLVSTIVSVVFGLILLLFSFLVKVGKTYPYVKR